MIGMVPKAPSSPAPKRIKRSRSLSVNPIAAGTKKKATARACSQKERRLIAAGWARVMISLLILAVVRIRREPRAEPLHVGDEREAALVQLAGITVEEPGILGHDRQGRGIAWPVEVGGMPVVGASAPFTAQIGPDAA